VSSLEAELEEVVVSTTRTNMHIEDLPQKVEVLGQEEMDEESTLVPSGVGSILGDIAVITLNNPPVNGLGHATRTGIVEGIAKAADNAGIKAVVIVGEGRGFSGGADIREFNTPKAMQEPSLMTVISIVEACEKPVIAAIHGVAMGGGLELALGCHYRVAVAGAQIALPEVNIGILPGAGGTQRLPRILGLEPALNMIVSGKTVMSDKLASTKLFDQMLTGDLLEGALAYAKKIADVRPLPKIRDIKIKYPNADGYLQFARNTVRVVAGPFRRWQRRRWPASTIALRGRHCRWRLSGFLVARYQSTRAVDQCASRCRRRTRSRVLPSNR